MAPGRGVFVLLLAALDVAWGRWPPEKLSKVYDCEVELGKADISEHQDAIALTSVHGGYSSSPIFMTLYTSSPLAKRNTTVKTALIFVHGRGANANSYFCEGLTMARDQVEVPHEEVLVVVPWFGDEQVTAKQWSSQYAPQGGVSAFWSAASWLLGGDTEEGSPAPEYGFTNSLDILDDLVGHLRNKDLFPELKQITVAGFSAGGQLTGRWATVSPVLAGEVPVRVLVSSPSTYLYFDELRPAKACRENRDTGTAFTCNTFEVPEEGESCAEFNVWKFGISGFSGSRYLDRLSGNASELANLKHSFSKKDVHFFCGTEDSCNCVTDGFTNHKLCSTEDCASGCCDTYPASQSNKMEASCGALLQGSNRLQRAINYVAYLNLAIPGFNKVLHLFRGAHWRGNFARSRDFQELAFYRDPETEYELVQTRRKRSSKMVDWHNSSSSTAEQCVMHM